MGAPKKYTPESLDRAVRKYFRSISREKALTEKKPTGIKDDKGHMIFTDEPVINSLGKIMVITEYLVPPTIGDLSRFLGIHRDTWHDYCDHEKHPEFSDTTTYAQGCIHAYLERELLTRSGKDVKGVQFNLENNFGYKEKVAVNEDTLEKFLMRQSDEGEGQRF